MKYIEGGMKKFLKVLKLTGLLVLLLMVLLFAFAEIVIFILEQNIMFLIDSAKAIFVFLIILLPSMNLLLRAWCYKIEINNTTNMITFYRFFNRGVHKFRMDNISIIIGGTSNIYVDNERFVLHDAFIHDLVAYLPSNTQIEYKGFRGNQKRRNWEEGGTPFIPGSRL